MIVSEDLAIQVIEQAIPLHKFLRVKVLALSQGYCKILFPYREEVLGNFLSKNWHGGMVAAALDAAGGAVGMLTLSSAEDKLATIDIRVDYLRSTGPSDLVVVGEMVRSGNRIIATNMQAWQENEEKLVAEARAMYSVYRKSTQNIPA